MQAECRMVKLKSDLKREIAIGNVAYVVTITQLGLRLVVKGRRKGIELSWKDLVSGEAAMAVALRASLSAPGPLAAKKK